MSPSLVAPSGSGRCCKVSTIGGPPFLKQGARTQKRGQCLPAFLLHAGLSLAEKHGMSNRLAPSSASSCLHWIRCINNTQVALARCLGFLFSFFFKALKIRGLFVTFFFPSSLFSFQTLAPGHSINL